MSQAVVFIVATPIGNLDDMTPRAIATLKNVHIIAAEDTRNTRKLLTHFGIMGQELVSYHDHGEESKAIALLDRLQADDLSLALVSDAGTPCIADPGYRLVKLAKERGIKVHPIPGASALTSLISASGLPSNRFTFVGFLPTKASELKSEIQSWSSLGGTVVFYDPTRRLDVSLRAIASIYPNAVVAIGRELTKLYEEIVTIPVEQAIEWVNSHPVLKGEASVMVDLNLDAAVQQEGEQDMEQMITAAAKRGFEQGKTLKDLLKEFSGSGLGRSELYQLLLNVKTKI